MEGDEPKPYGMALRRFLISSSSSSSSSPPRGEGAANASGRVVLNTSSVSTFSSTSSAATSARNYSQHSTPPQTRLQHTVEKAAPESPSPEAHFAGNLQHPRRRLESSDSVESQDYVDALASSAFQTCHSGNRTVTQTLLSLTDAGPAVLYGADEAPSTLLEGQENTIFDEEVQVREEAHDAERVDEDAAHGKNSPQSSDDEQHVVSADDDAAAVIFSSSSAGNGGYGSGHSLEGEHEPETKRREELPHSLTRETVEKVATPTSMHLAAPLPPSPHHSGEGHSHDSTNTTSSSRHQVGVWKAIYGKEKWSGPRRSYSPEEPPSEDAAMLNADQLSAFLPTAAAATAAAVTNIAASSSHSEDDQAPPSSSVAAAASRHADSLQWAATRRTALEMLRAQLDSSDGHSANAGAPRSHRARGSLSREQCESSEAAEEPTIPETEVQGPEEEAETEHESPFQVVEVFEGQPTPTRVVTDITQDRADAATGVSALDNLLAVEQLQDSNEPAVSTVQRRRTAEEVLAQLFSGIPSHTTESTNDSAPREAASVSGVGNDSVTSPLKSHSATARMSRLVVRPTLSAEVSDISPIKNEAPSILVDLYDTPETRPARPARTPVDAAVAATRMVDRVGTYVLTSPVEQRRQESCVVSEGREEYTLDMSAMDFRTAQTAPTSFSESDMSDASVDGGAELQTVQQQEVRGQPHNDGESSRARQQHSHTREISDVPPPASASALRPDNKVSLFPATPVNAWDISRVKKWRSQEPPEQQSGAAAETASTIRDATPAVVRQERVRKEMQAKELAECSFHPTLSPGTRAMVRMAQEREMKKTLDDEYSPPPPSSSAAAGRTDRKYLTKRAAATSTSGAGAASTFDSGTLKATLQDVYERLYPVELSAAASRKQILDQEIEYRRLAREELIVLRRRAGVVPRAARSRGASQRRDVFDTFMSNMLQVHWEHAANPRTAQPSAVVLETSYMSPMAVALLEEKEVKRRSNTRREAEMQLSHLQDAAGNSNNINARAQVESSGAQSANASAASVVVPGTNSEDTFRIALFDEFLLRQNAYYFNRARAVRDLKRQLTPAFTPATTQRSARLVREMVSRSLMNDSMGPETSSLLTQRQRQHIPMDSAFLPQHQSPYRDPCTFQPQLSPSVRAAKAEERQRRQTMSPTTPTAHRKAVFDRLYGDHARMTKQREKAKEAANTEEMAGVTFTPKLNSSRKDQVRSVLNPKNYDHFQQSLQQKRQALDAQRQAQLNKSEESEEVICTFRPQTTKTPAYISKMAKSFGLLRQQDAEF